MATTTESILGAGITTLRSNNSSFDLPRRPNINLNVNLGNDPQLNLPFRMPFSTPTFSPFQFNPSLPPSFSPVDPQLRFQQNSASWATPPQPTASSQSSRPKPADRLNVFLGGTSMEKFDIPIAKTTDPNSTFSCTFRDCKKIFEKKRQLLEHWRICHPSTKPYMCQHSNCNKSFLRPAHLAIHERIHTGEKPFICTIDGCGKKWSQKSALTQHMRSHTGEKPFICPFDGCGKKFSTSSSCKRHSAIHTGSNEPAPDVENDLNKRMAVQFIMN